jgi:sialic acid synthase SpsE/quercetin dioxygenase-like cupin family protein
MGRRPAMTTMVFDDLFIFELANNHEGDLAHGLAIVEAVAGIVARRKIRGAIKLQYRDLDSFIHRDHRKDSRAAHIPRFLRTRLSKSDFLCLVTATRERGLCPIVTAFDEASVDLALEHDAEVLKVASCSANDWPLLERIAAAKKPVVCSTGGCPIRQIDNIVNFFEHHNVTDLALLHCVAQYPTPSHGAQMGFLRRMMRRYRKVPVGYSGHEAPDNLDVVKAAVAMGATVLERHVCLPNERVTANAYSLDPAQTEAWVCAALEMREICRGEDERPLNPEETRSLRSLMRGAFAARDIRAGQTIERRSVYFAMPRLEEDQTSAADFAEGVASRDYLAHAPIRERRPPTPAALLREILHEAKGMLGEACVEIGPEYTVEVSHHHGLDAFRRVGMVIVRLMNHEYCKKVLVMVPGQSHPTHFHQKKEESFHVLKGELELILDGHRRALKAGDMQLVRRGQRHGFSTTEGCIVEEISTTHLSGDSYYDDPVVARLDPMERKTIVESW